MLAAIGATIHIELTRIDKGGKKGRMLLHILGKNRLRSKPTARGEITIFKILETICLRSTGDFSPISKSDKSGVTEIEIAVDNEVATMLSGAIVGSIRKVA